MLKTFLMAGEMSGNSSSDIKNRQPNNHVNKMVRLDFTVLLLMTYVLADRVCH